MIGMVLVAHGNLGIAFRAALEHVLGPQDHFATIAIGPEDDIDHCREAIDHAVHEVDSGDGVVLLTDMLGGTPANLALSFMYGKKVDVLAGINLPMLIRLASIRESCNLEQAVVSAQEAGRKYINIASCILGKK